MALNVDGKVNKVKSVCEVLDAVRNIQHVEFVCSGLKKCSIADGSEVIIDLYHPEAYKQRYTVYIVDIKPMRSHLKYAAFIVPQGRWRIF